MTEKHAIIVTSAMERALREKKLSLESLIDYPLMSQHFSPNDLAAFLALQTHPSVKTLWADSKFALIEKWSRSANQEQFTELDSTLLPLSQSSAVQAYLNEQLNAPQGQEPDREACPVQVFDLASETFAISVEPGVKEYLTQSYNEIAVVRVIMKVLLQYIPLHLLACQPGVFQRWIRLTAIQSVLRPPQAVYE